MSNVMVRNFARETLLYDSSISLTNEVKDSQMKIKFTHEIFISHIDLKPRETDETRGPYVKRHVNFC